MVASYSFVLLMKLKLGFFGHRVRQLNLKSVAKLGKEVKKKKIKKKILIWKLHFFSTKKHLLEPLLQALC